MIFDIRHEMDDFVSVRQLVAGRKKYEFFRMGFKTVSYTI